MQTMTNTPDQAQDTETQHSQAMQVLTSWIEALGAGELETLLNLYAERSILVPTLQNTLCSSAAARRSYFEMLLANPEMACRLDHVQTICAQDPNTLLAAGHYTFTFKQNGTTQAIPARFMFTFEQIDGQWRISGHHSSKFL